VFVPSHVSVVQGSPSSGQAAPALPAGCWQELLLPSHWSSVQGLLSGVQAAPAAFLRSVGQVVLVPVQFSAKSHSSAAARHWAPALPAGCWHELLVPLHWSSVQGLVSAVQAVPDGFLVSDGHVVLVPVQVSTASHSPAAARQVAPALPAGCVQVALVPLHMSTVQGLLSAKLVQAVLLGAKASVGQAVLAPVQVSATSHSFTAARHTVPWGCTAPVSAGHAALVPVQVSGRSQAALAARQICEVP